MSGNCSRVQKEEQDKKCWQTKQQLFCHVANSPGGWLHTLSTNCLEVSTSNVSQMFAIFNGKTIHKQSPDFIALIQDEMRLLNLSLMVWGTPTNSFSLPGKGFTWNSKTLSKRYSWNTIFFEGEITLISNWRVINWEDINVWLFIMSIFKQTRLQSLSKCCTGSWGSPAVVAGSKHKPSSNSWNRNHCRQPKVNLPPTATPVLGGCKSWDNFLVHLGDLKLWNVVLKLQLYNGIPIYLVIQYSQCFYKFYEQVVWTRWSECMEFMVYL